MKNIKVAGIIFLFFIFASCRQKTKNPSLIISENKTAFSAALLPYNGFDTALIPFVKNEISQFYNCPVAILPAVDLPQSAFYAPRQRYKADSLLQFQKVMAQNFTSVVGLTGKDISTANGQKTDWGVFGLGYCPGRACVISVYRLKKTSASSPQLKERLAKVVLHEMGHNFGLPHCNKNITCLMNDAGGKIQQVDREQKWLCANCKKLLGQ